MTTTESKLPGIFVVVEGVDGCGSTTHSRLLAKSLRSTGREVTLTCEPTAGPIGGLIRQILQHRVSAPKGFSWATMTLLFAADRLDHLDSEILPALREGGVVVSDRYDLSSLAYQSATSPDPQSAIPWIRAMNARAIRPHVTVVIDVPPDVAAERRRLRGGVEEVFESSALQERLVSIYAHAETLVPGDHVVHVSGVGDPGAVSARVLAAVREAAPALRNS